MRTILVGLSILVLLPLLVEGCGERTEEIERPERIVSMREVVYDRTTYVKLAGLWRAYNDRFPSEDAYANWMYAARYAQDPDYESLLKAGRSRYPANPVLLYLDAMVHHGRSGDLEAQHLLERATRLDPSFMDPWFSLVIHYMERRDLERLDAVLRRLLESGAVQDEVMDFSYNMMSLLEKNAILITNGDNDTYPGWILGRIVKHRPDITIVNRSLLNTDWYPDFLAQVNGVVILSSKRLESLRKETMNAIKEGKRKMPEGGPFSDMLIESLIDAAERSGRPVYFAHTLGSSETIDWYRKNGRSLGLATLVTQSRDSYSVQLKRMAKRWTEQFRTAGVESWRVKHAPPAMAGRQIVTNYVAGLYAVLDAITQHAPEYRKALFTWYVDYARDVTAPKFTESMDAAWCKISDVKEIREWCRNRMTIE
ncbi:MAG: hypothetical protein FJ215_09625 [Ignavibacteria bacterium]|nr:hypothetical protein [Ignavibacteria bacterium]